MTNIEKQSILGKSTVGYWSALGGIEVKAICGEALQCISNAWAGVKKAHSVRVYYTLGGRAYIRLYGHRYYLDECLRA